MAGFSNRSTEDPRGSTTISPYGDPDRADSVDSPPPPLCSLSHDASRAIPRRRAFPLSSRSRRTAEIKKNRPDWFDCNFPRSSYSLDGRTYDRSMCVLAGYATAVRAALASSDITAKCMVNQEIPSSSVLFSGPRDYTGAKDLALQRARSPFVEICAFAHRRGNRATKKNSIPTARSGTKKGTVSNTL